MTKREIESAAGMHLGLCPFCDMVHLCFYDENGDDFAEGVMDAEEARRLIHDLQQMLYAQAVDSDESAMQ